MKKIILIIITLNFIISCNNNTIKNKKHTREQLKSIINKNSNNFTFMNFYPNMGDEVFNYIVKEKVSTGKLKKKKAKYINDYYYCYTLNSYDYSIFYNSFSVTLYKTMPSLTKKREYLSDIKSLSELFKEKYGESIKIQNKKFNDYIIFNNDRKVVTISGKYTSALNNGDINWEDHKYYNSDYQIEINFYTKKSFENEKSEEKEYEKFKKEQRIDKYIKDSIKKVREHKELMNNI